MPQRKKSFPGERKSCSDVSSLKNAMDVYLKNNNYDRFEKLLNYEIIHSSITRTESVDQPERATWYYSDKGLVVSDCQVSPFIEMIYVNYPQDFRRILLSILSMSEKNQPSMAKALFASWNKALLDKETDLPQKMFEWDKEQAANTQACLTALENHGRKLAESTKPGSAGKRDTVLALCDKIKMKIAGFNDQADPIKVALFKLDLAKDLNSQNAILGKSRDSKGLHDIANVFAALSFIAPIVNKAVTGNWFFFHKTEAMKAVNNTQKAFDPTLKLPTGENDNAREYKLSR